VTTLSNSAPPEPSTQQPVAASSGIDGWLSSFGASQAGLSSFEAKRRRLLALQQLKDSSGSVFSRLASRLSPPACVLGFASHALGQCADVKHVALFFFALSATLLGLPETGAALVVMAVLRVGLLAGIETYEDMAQARLDQARRPRARVRRDGRTQLLDAGELVSGDIIELRAGDRIPADVQVFESNDLVIHGEPVAATRAGPIKAWAHGWVSKGRGVALVVAAGAQAQGSVVSRLGINGAPEANDPTADEFEPEHSAPDRKPSQWQRPQRADLAVIGLAVCLLLAAVARDASLPVATLLLAGVFVAMLWRVHDALGGPAQRLSIIHAAMRIAKLGVYAKDLRGLQHLADVPTQDDAPHTPPPVPVTTAGTDDTDHARLAADLVFNAPTAQIESLALKAARIARNAHAGQVRTHRFGMTAWLGLMFAIPWQAALGPAPWPVAVLMGLHLLVFVLTLALSLVPVRGAASRTRHLTDDPLISRHQRQATVAWCLALVAGLAAAHALAPSLNVDALSLMFVTAALSVVTLTWLALFALGGAGWRLRRLAVAHVKDVVQLAPISGLALALLLAAIYGPSWQAAFGAHALSFQAWALAAAMALLTAGAIPLSLLLSEKKRLSTREPNASTVVPNASSTVPAAAAQVEDSPPPKSQQDGSTQAAKQLPLFGAAIVAFAAGFFALAHPSPAAAQSDQRTAALTVHTVRAHRTQWPMSVQAHGDIAAWQEVIVSAQINHYPITQVPVNVGDRVKKGQLLAKISDATVAAELAQAQALVQESKAQLAQARANAQRARDLQSTGVFSNQQITQIFTEESSAQARLASAQAQVKIASLRLAYTRVLAPVDGVIASRIATVGALAQTGQELFRMIREGRLEWRAEVDATRLAHIQPGQPAHVLSSDGSPAQGKVRIVSPTVDPKTRTGLVYVDLPTGHPTLRAGMFTSGQIMIGQSAALALPQSAVLVRDGFSYVFVVDAHERVIQKKVQTGRRQGQAIEILEGLDAQSDVVASGVGFLAHGDQVRVLGPAPQNAKR